MSDLRPNLFDTDFEQLVAQSRAMLPKLAPGWTDHNLHDPGIMLIELLAWTTEAQIYSLARLRTDERRAFAALLGFKPQGPLAARGLVWPSAKSRPRPWEQNGVLLPVHSMVSVMDQPLLPSFRLCHDLNLTAAQLTDVETHLEERKIIYQTAANFRTGAGFYPFGEQARAGDRLVLRFRGVLLAPDTQELKARHTFLSLGIRVSSGGAAVSAMEPKRRRIEAHLLVGQLSYPLTVHEDGTHGFLRTGAILLGLGAVPDGLGSDFAIEIRSRAAGFYGPPWILSILPNVLPVEQIVLHRDQKLAVSSGGPDQTYGLDDTSAGLPASAPAPIVRVKPNDGASATWKLVQDFRQAIPDERCFTFDPAFLQIHFGNGVNGAIPAQDSILEVDYETTEGAAGNLTSGMFWQVQGLPDVFGQNLDPMAGGEAAWDLLELRRRARVSVREDHAIVTAPDLTQAALALRELRVVRAESPHVPEWRASCAAMADQRTLVVLRARPPVEIPGVRPESPAWLGEVRRELAGRLPLGERLRVIAPDYEALRLKILLQARSGFDPQSIAEAAWVMLAGYFRLVPEMVGDDVWPLGRQVSTLELRGRLQRLEGVAAVQDCTLLWGEATAPVAAPSFTRYFLPLLRPAQSQLVVGRRS